MRYAQVVSGEKLHLVYEAGEGVHRSQLVPAGYLSLPLCGRKVVGGYHMTTNVPLSNACRNCLRVADARCEKL